MDTFKTKIKEFNSRSRNTEDHFKLCTTCEKTNGGNTTTYELRLCSCHPRVITCTVDTRHIHVIYHGPSAFRQTFEHDHESLLALLKLLHFHRDDNACDILLEWEMEDWASGGYPCKMYNLQTQPQFQDLGFSPEDLWCIDLLPSRAAYL